MLLRLWKKCGCCDPWGHDKGAGLVLFFFSVHFLHSFTTLRHSIESYFEQVLFSWTCTIVKLIWQLDRSVIRLSDPYVEHNSEPENTETPQTGTSQDRRCIFCIIFHTGTDNHTVQRHQWRTAGFNSGLYAVLHPVLVKAMIQTPSTRARDAFSWI